MKQITKKFFLIIALVLFFAVSCASTSDKNIAPSASADSEEVVIKEKAESVNSVAPAVQEKAKEESPVVKEAKTETPVVSESKTEAPKSDFKYAYSYEFGGYEIGVEVHDGYGYVTYPEFITDEEIEEALSAFVAEHGDFGVTFRKVAENKLEVYYQKGLQAEDFNYMAGIVSEDLTWYLNEMFFAEEEKPVVVTVKEAEDAKSDFEYIYSYEFEGYEIGVEVHDGYGYVTYPAFITDKEIEEALSAFVAEHGDFGVTFRKVADNKLEVYYQKGLQAEDFNYMAGIVSEDLTWYLNEMFFAEEEKPVVVNVTAKEVKVEKQEPAAQVEPSKSEAVAPVEASSPKAAEKAPVDVVPVTEEKGVSVGLIAAICVVVVGCAAFFVIRSKKK